MGELNRIPRDLLTNAPDIQNQKHNGFFHIMVRLTQTGPVMKLTNELKPGDSPDSTAQNTSKLEYAYFGGDFVPFHEATLSIRNPAFLYGTSLFEGIRGYWLPETRQLSIFRMKEHYQRLLNNSKLFYLTPDLSLDDLCEITVGLIQRNQPDSDMYIRPTLFKNGESITPTLEHTITDFCLWTKPLGEYLDLSKGLSVC